VASWRQPIGTYVRNTPDWFQARQCFATAYADFSTLAPIVVGATGTNTNTAIVPSGTRINDLMLACFNAANATQAPSPGPWTLLQNVTAANPGFWWWKYFQAGDPSSFTSTNTLTVTGGNLVTVRGAAVGSTNPFDTLGSGVPNTNPMTAAAITATGSEPELLLLQLYTGIFNKWNATPGYTELANISDVSLGNSPGMALASTLGTGTIPAVTTSFSALVSNNSQYQQVLIPRATFSPYASLYNNATDGSVLYVTGLEVDFDAADQLLVSLNSGLDTVPYALPYGVFPKNPLAAGPPGMLFSAPGSQLLGYIFQSPPNTTSYRRRPSDGDYVAIIPPGYALVVTNANLGAKRMAASFDYFYLPSAA
jgi:hypothetical protein